MSQTIFTFSLSNQQIKKQQELYEQIYSGTGPDAGLCFLF